jgi:hypothetical protein
VRHGFGQYVPLPYMGAEKDDSCRALMDLLHAKSFQTLFTYPCHVDVS